MSSNCLEVVRPFVNEANSQGLDYQVFGGVGSYALKDVNVEILPDEEIVYAGREVDFDKLPLIRKNGSVRDLDLLIRTTDQSTVDRAAELASDIVGSKLEISAFGYQPLSKYERMLLNPVVGSSMSWVSDRFVSLSSGKVEVAKKAVFPFSVDIDPESLKSWELIVHGSPEPIPISHPGAVLTNYLTRSLSGVRPKDKPKVRELAQNLFKKYPELTEWLHDGPGRTQLDLANVLHSLRAPRHRSPIYLGGNLSVTAVPFEDVIEHPSNMYSGNPNEAKLHARIAVLKSRVLHLFEGQERIVAPYQKYAESHMRLFTGARS